MKTKTKTPPGDFPSFTGIYFGEYSLCFLIIGKGPTTKSCKYEVKRLNSYIRARSLVVIDLGLETKRFPVRVRLLAMRRGELHAVIARLMSECL